MDERLLTLCLCVSVSPWLTAVRKSTLEMKSSRLIIRQWWDPSLSLRLYSICCLNEHFFNKFLCGICRVAGCFWKFNSHVLVLCTKSEWCARASSYTPLQHHWTCCCLSGGSSVSPKYCMRMWICYSDWMNVLLYSSWGHSLICCSQELFSWSRASAQSHS